MPFIIQRAHGAREEGGRMIRTFISGAVPAWAVLSAAILFFACAVKPAVTVTDADNGTKVEIKTDEVLAVKLEAQLGTGFGWKVVSESAALVLKGDPEQVSSTDQKPGGPEYQTFKFKAVKKERDRPQVPVCRRLEEGCKTPERIYDYRHCEITVFA